MAKIGMDPVSLAHITKHGYCMIVLYFCILTHKSLLVDVSLIQVLYPVDSIFYLVGLREFPRATMIYMFLFDYGTFFYPVMKYAYGPGKPSTSAGLTQVL